MVKAVRHITCKGRGGVTGFYAGLFQLTSFVMAAHLSPPRRCFTFAAPKGGQLPITAWLADLAPPGLNPRPHEHLVLKAEC